MHMTEVIRKGYCSIRKLDLSYKGLSDAYASFPTGDIWIELQTMKTSLCHRNKLFPLRGFLRTLLTSVGVHWQLLPSAEFSCSTPLNNDWIAHVAWPCILCTRCTRCTHRPSTLLMSWSSSTDAGLLLYFLFLEALCVLEWSGLLLGSGAQMCIQCWLFQLKTNDHFTASEDCGQPVHI